jgi:hypothetical protein
MNQQFQKIWVSTMQIFEDEDQRQGLGRPAHELGRRLESAKTLHLRPVRRWRCAAEELLQRCRGRRAGQRHQVAQYLMRGVQGITSESLASSSDNGQTLHLRPAANLLREPGLARAHRAAEENEATFLAAGQTPDSLVDEGQLALTAHEGPAPDPGGAKLLHLDGKPGAGKVIDGPDDLLAGSGPGGRVLGQEVAENHRKAFGEAFHQLGRERGIPSQVPIDDDIRCRAVERPMARHSPIKCGTQGVKI